MRQPTDRTGLHTGLLATAGFAAFATFTVFAAGCSGASSTPDGGAAPAATAARLGVAPSNVTSLVQTGINQAESHNVTAAQGTFKQVLALEPDNKYAWFNLGVIAQGGGDTSAAVTDYDEALQTDPAFRSALYNKALALEAANPDLAEQLYRKAIAVDPKASTAYLHLGLLLQKTDPAAASDAFDKAVALDPSLAQYVPNAAAQDK